MSDILIKGIEMPKEGSWRTVRIYPDGTCAVPNWQGDCTHIKGAKAVPVPPHGRLGDLDNLRKKLETICDRCDAGIISKVLCMNLMLQTIISAPTIIPAEEEKV